MCCGESYQLRVREYQMGPMKGLKGRGKEKEREKRKRKRMMKVKKKRQMGT